jgi:hypothetical protein
MKGTNGPSRGRIHGKGTLSIFLDLRRFFSGTARSGVGFEGMGDMSGCVRCRRALGERLALVGWLPLGVHAGAADAGVLDLWV